MLTAKQIENAKPRDKAFKLSDEKGLFLHVMPNGSRYWRLKFRVDGKEKLLALGVYPEVTLAEAREKREEARKTLRDGLDPAREKRVAKEARLAAPTFADVEKDFRAKQIAEGKAARTIQKHDYLMSLIPPRFAALRIADISSPETLAVLEKVAARGNHEAARRLRGQMGSIFRYGIATGRCGVDPSAALKGALITPTVKHRAAILDPARLGEFLRALDAFGGRPETVAALKMLTLTFVRPGELRFATWDEFDLDGAVWRIPAARTKMRREHVVPLCRQALALLVELHRTSGDGRLVFHGIRSRDKPLSENTLNISMRCMGFGTDEVCSHGFRSTFSTLANESGQWSPDAIERALGHEDRNATRKAYNRGGYLDERIRMMAWWGDRLDSLRTGAEKVPMQNGVAT